MALRRSWVRAPLGPPYKFILAEMEVVGYLLASWDDPVQAQQCVRRARLRKILSLAELVHQPAREGLGAE